VQHGPMSLVEPGYPLLILATQDETLDGVTTLAGAMREKGARILLAANDPRVLAKADIPLPLPAPLHPVLDPIIAVQAFYPFVTSLAQARGYDPDAPRHLRKVTQTR
ncbi:MAG: SIS domain-containing protein, partial [Alphaproteobacteria bacterium]